MNNHWMLVVWLSLGVGWTGTVLGDELSPEKRADIHQLLDMTGSLQLGRKMSDAVTAEMTRMLKESRPDIDPVLFDVLREEVNDAVKASMPLFAKMMIPVYHQHFTHDEIRGLIVFYRTDLGRKTIRVMPQVLQESIAIGQQWGQALGPEIQRRVIQRFKAEGVDLAA